MSFLEEMTNLGENLLRAAQNRKKNVGVIIGSTQRLLDNTRRGQRENAKKQHQFLGKFTDGLSEFADGFSQKNRNMMSGFHKQHREAAKKQSNFLENFTEKNSAIVGSFLGKCNKDRMKFRGELDQAHKNFIHSLREIEKLHGRSPSCRPTKGENGEKTPVSPNPKRGKRAKRRVA